MEIGYSSGEVTVSVTRSRKLPLALPKPSENFTMRKIENGVTMQQDCPKEDRDQSASCACVSVG